LAEIDPALYALLKERGGSDDDIENAARAGQHFLNAYAAELLICPPGTLTLDETAVQVGVDAAQIASWWKALGFADPSTDGFKFSAADVHALQTIAALALILPDDIVDDLARVWGVSAQQLAHAGVNAMRVGFEQPLVAEGATSLDVEIAYGEVVNGIVPGVVEAWGTLFRHHLVAATYEDVAVSADGFVQTTQTIAFVDLVDFTGYAQRAHVGDLARTLSRFESNAAAIAARHDGRVVKLLGDGIMLRFAKREAAIAAVCAIVGGGEGPACRAGIATGPLLTRQGDFYGPVVNLASRLSGVVAPGQVAVDSTSPVDGGEVAEPVVLKGIDEPVAYYRLVSAGG
jgi:adenylate cyclase